MSEETQEKFVVIVTHGPEHPELATIPFVMAAAALVSEIDVCMAFQGDGVNLIRKDGAAHVVAHGFPALAELMQSVVELGGQLLACAPCLQSREIKAPDDLEPGVEVIGAARLVAEIAAARNTLTY